jgi:hypothetical protein
MRAACVALVTLLAILASSSDAQARRRASIGGIDVDVAQAGCLAMPGTLLALSCPQITWNNLWSIRAGHFRKKCAREANGLVRWTRVDDGPSYTCQLAPRREPRSRRVTS